MTNTQPIEKRVLITDGTYSVHSIFRTIQGEGPFCGSPCVFIRLAGCNLQCPGCDTDYTEGRYNATVRDIILEVTKHQQEGLVVITGGEPFRQDLLELLLELIRMGFYIQIETNGTLPPPDIPYMKSPHLKHGVYIVCSPKTGSLNPVIMKKACAFKYVLAHDSVNETDGLPVKALGHSAHPYVARPREDALVYLQPMDSSDYTLNLKAVIKSCMAHGYTLQLQVHKIIGME